MADVCDGESGSVGHVCRMYDLSVVHMLVANTVSSSSSSSFVYEYVKEFLLCFQLSMQTVDQGCTVI